MFCSITQLEMAVVFDHINMNISYENTMKTSCHLTCGADKSLQIIMWKIETTNTVKYTGCAHKHLKCSDHINMNVSYQNTMKTSHHLTWGAGKSLQIILWKIETTNTVKHTGCAHKHPKCSDHINMNVSYQNTTKTSCHLTWGAGQSFENIMWKIETKNTVKHTGCAHKCLKFSDPMTISFWKINLGITGIVWNL